MSALFESEWLDFSQDPAVPVVVQHNLGRSPVVIQFMGRDGENIGFPTLMDENGIPVSGPYLDQTTDPNAVNVFKPAAYTFSGQFKVLILE